MALGAPTLSTYTGKGAADPTAGTSSFTGAQGSAWNTGPNGAYLQAGPGGYPTDTTVMNWGPNTVSMFGNHGPVPPGFDSGTNSFVGGGGATYATGGSGTNLSDPATRALYDYLNAQYQSNLSRLQSQLSGYGIDADYQSRLLGLNTNFANQDYALQLAKINQAQLQNSTLPLQDVGAQRDYLNTLAGLLPQSRALNSATQQNAYGRAQLDYDTAFRNSLSDAVSRGAVNSQGLRDTRDEIARQLGLSRGSADINFGRQSISATQDEASLKRDQALLNTKEQTLNSIAKDYGIDRQTAELALRQGLAKLGLDYDATIAKINNSSGDTRRQLEQLAPMLWQQAMSLAGQG